MSHADFPKRTKLKAGEITKSHNLEGNANVRLAGWRIFSGWWMITWPYLVPKSRRLIRHGHVWTATGIGMGWWMCASCTLHQSFFQPGVPSPSQNNNSNYIIWEDKLQRTAAVNPVSISFFLFLGHTPFQVRATKERCGSTSYLRAISAWQTNRFRQALSYCTANGNGLQGPASCPDPQPPLSNTPFWTILVFWHPPSHVKLI